MPDKKKIAIYSRKSKFTGKGESIDNQIELCKQYIARNFGSNEAEDAFIFEDEGFSGSHIKRPQFQEMMEKANRKDLSMIVCYRLDRISRNIGDFAKLIQDLNDLEISFVSIKEQFDTSSPLGRAMMYIASVFSQLERETIAERIKDNMQELAKTGRWLGGTTPTGYESEYIEVLTQDNKHKKLCALKIIPQEASLVELIYQTFYRTQSLSKTESHFLQRGIKTKNNKYFSRFAIKNILTNPVYAKADQFLYDYLQTKSAQIYTPKEKFDGTHGLICYNRTEQKKGKANRLKPLDEWVFAMGEHEGIVNSELWVSVQTMMEQNKSKEYRRPRNDLALLSGLLICGNCQHYMRPKRKTKKNGNGEIIFYYVCSMKEKSCRHLCDINNKRGNELDKNIINIIKNFPYDIETYRFVLKEEQRNIKKQYENLPKKNQEYEKELEKQNHRIALLIQTLENNKNVSCEQTILQRIENLQKENADIKRCLKKYEGQENFLLEEQRKEIINQVLHHSVMFEDIKLEFLRYELKRVIGKIMWDGENIQLIWKNCENSYDHLKNS